MNLPCLDGTNHRIAGTAKAYIRNVAEIFNHVRDVEINQMGYGAPPFANGQGFYEIYVKDMDDYGVTNFDGGSPINNNESPPRFNSSMTIDNDFQESQYDSHGIEDQK